MNFKLHDYQQRAADHLLPALRQTGSTIDASDCGIGKGQPWGSKILTPHGWCLIEDIRPGHRVIDSSGSASVVTGVFPKQPQPTYRVTLSDKTQFVVDEDHLHLCKTYNDKVRGKGWRVLSTRELLNSKLRYGSGGKGRVWEIPVVADVLFEEVKPPTIDPYIMGVMLGDGMINHNFVVSSADSEVIARYNERLPEGLKLTKRGRYRKYDYALQAPSTGGKRHPFREAFVKYGLYGKKSQDKFVPPDYLFGNVSTRLELLRGLMDTDGYIAKKGGTCEFYSVSRELAEAVVHLTQSLGCTPKIQTKPSWFDGRRYRDCFRVTFSCPHHNPFTLPRKAGRWNPTPRTFGRRIDRIDFEKTQNTICLSVDSPDHSYVTENFTVTHNTYIGAELAKQLGSSAFVVAPKNTLPAWQEVLESAGVTIDSLLSWEKARRHTKDLTRVPGRLFLFDEVHKAKNRKTANAKLLLKAATLGRVHMMSATAVMDPLDMGAIGPVLGLFSPSQYWNWCLQHGCKKGVWGGLVFSGGDKVLEKIHEYIFPDKGARLQRDEVPNFPECDIEVVELDLGVQVARAYKQMAQQAGIRVDALFGEAEEVDHPLTRNLKLRQGVEIAKAPALIEIVQDHLDNGMAPVLFLNFKETIALIEGQFPGCAVIEGGRDNKAEMNKFQSGKSNVCLVSITAGGTGISLHDVNGTRPRAGLMCPTDDPRAAEQARGRIWRNGSKSKALLKQIFAAGTVEAKMADREAKKLKKISIINQGMTQKSVTPKSATKKPRRKRSEFPPSALENFEASSCFEPDRFVATPFTESGQRVHKIAETGDLSKGADPEEEELGQKCLDYAALFKGKVWKEQRLTIRPGTYGLADHVVLNGNHIDLIDWKAGNYKQASAEVNFQQQAYVIALFNLHPTVSSITVHLVYPRRDELSRHTYQRRELPKLTNRLEDTVAAVQAARTSGERTVSVACRNCAKKGGCPAFAQKAADVASKYNNDLVVPDFATHASQVTDAKMMGHLLNVKKTMEEWCASVDFHAKKLMLEQGVTPEGYEMKHRKGRGELTDALAVYGAVMDVLVPEEFMPACSVSIAKLKKAYREKAKRGFKKQAEEDLEEKLAELGILIKKDDQPYLAKVKD